MKIMILILFLLVFQACATRASENQITGDSKTALSNASPTKPVDAVPVEENSENVGRDDYDIANSPGFVIANDKLYEKGRFVRIYNQDGSIWYEFTFFSDDRNKEFKFENEEFRPFRYSADPLHIVFKCVGEDSLYYHVIVNEETGLIKFVRKNDPVLDLRKWEQYVLDCFAVGFDKERNPLHTEPNGELITENMPKRLTFHPEEIKGEWLKVRWHDEDDKTKQKPKFGWVRWKKDNKIIVSLFEIA